MTGFDPDSLAVNRQDLDDFADNITVFESPISGLSVAEVENALKRELLAGGAKEVQIAKRAMVEGEESAHISSEGSLNGISFTTDQYYLENQSQAFVLTLSFSRTESAAARADVAQTVLASWSWTD